MGFSLRESPLELFPCIFLTLSRERMYQGRIQKWYLDKKLKAPEVAYTLREIDSRRSMGKETEILI